MLSCSGLWAQHLAAPVVFRLVFSLLRLLSAPCILPATGTLRLARTLRFARTLRLARPLRFAGHLAEGTQALQTGQDDSPTAELS